MPDMVPPLLLLFGVLTGRARHLNRPAHAVGDPPALNGSARDAGVSTLEMVIIALGLIAVATLLVVAITAAVTRRTNQIN